MSKINLSLIRLKDIIEARKYVYKSYIILTLSLHVFGICIEGQRVEEGYF